jgi:hypothetical protein
MGRSRLIPLGCNEKVRQYICWGAIDASLYAAYRSMDCVLEASPFITLAIPLFQF